MSSRRKSKPFRRLDTICYQLQEKQGGGGEASSNQNQEEESGTLPNATQKENEMLNGTNEHAEDSNETPPEGVYMIMPESVDENNPKQNCNKESKPKPDEITGKRRYSTEDNEDNSENFEKSGLDLSVKRRRLQHSAADSINVGNDGENNSYSSENSLQDQSTFFDKLNKYKEVMRLVEEQEPIPSALQKVGFSVHEFFQLHQINTQLLMKKEADDGVAMGNNSRNSPEMDNLFQKPENVQQSDRNSNQTNHQERIEALLREANNKILQQQQMQMVGNDNDNQSLDKTTTSSVDEKKQEMMKLLLMKAQSYFSKPVSIESNKPTTSSSFESPGKSNTITAGTVSTGIGSIKKGTLDPATFDEDVFDQYITKYTAFYQCEFANCPHRNKDHYHCSDKDCHYQRFTNRADVIRHYNMHKKRDNSLAHGFMRFAPTEDCSSKFDNCHLNGKSTHYHCLQSDCNKVYTSTSDVMTHENFHKKNYQFVCIGFKRFRATESCGLQSCLFFNQRTTHFHCTRRGCDYTFKNKCDIDKHKSYHVRDDSYASLGFKKFFKHEFCGRDNCAWNHNANHFHCLQCMYTFTSTGQMVSHRKKHERGEIPYQNHFRSISAGANTAVPMIDGNLLHEASRKALSIQPASASVSPSQAGYSPLSQSPVVTSQNSLMLSNASLIANALKDVPTTSSNIEASPNLKGHLIKQESDDNETENQEIREVWQNAVRGGLISPDMARNAAAAIQPKDENNFSNDGEESMDLTNSPNKQTDDEENNVKPQDDSYGVGSDGFPVFKYFVGAKAYECWIANCDFMHKHHFHCMVKNCAAMFATQENVLKHTKFHVNLEGLGAKLPIISVPNSSGDAKEDKEKPPPGFIKLESSSHGSSDNPQQVHLDSTSTAINLTKNNANKTNSLTTPQTSQTSNPHSMQTYAAQLYAASALLKDLKSSDSLLPSNSSASDNAIRKSPLLLPATTSLCPPQNNALTTYMALQNPSALSALINKTTQSQEFLQKLLAGQQVASLPINTLFERQSAFTPPAKPEESEKKSSEDKKSSGDGYIHIQAGMACLKSDCKYAMQTHWHCIMPRCRYVCKSLGKAQSHRQAHDSLEAYARSAKLSFKSYTAKKKCANATCEFRQRGHYHCLKPGCQFATIGSSKLPWHMKKHEKIARREASGFKYYTKKEQCGRFDCKYNGLFSHYHCIRTGCRFSFQYKHQMSTHVRKHLRRMLGRSYNGNEEIRDIDHANVDSGDETLPLIIDEIDELEQRPGTMEPVGDSIHSGGEESDESQGLSGAQREMLERTAKGMFIPTLSSGNSVDGFVRVNSTHDDDSSIRALDLTASPSIPMFNNTGMLAQYAAQKIQEALKMQNNGGPELDAANNDHQLSNSAESSMFNKFRLNSDLLDGFVRFEALDNCKDFDCTYNGKVTHFHCTAEGCFYRFTGRTHMYKHHQHHERVAALIQDDFKRFKAGQPCDVMECGFVKNTHFHCLRCSFKCTDSARVGTHRRQHTKADNLVQSGFQQYRGQENCGRQSCKYRTKNSSHFHCLKDGCSFAIIGLNGIEQHAKKHQTQEVAALLAQNQHSSLHNMVALQQRMTEGDLSNDMGSSSGAMPVSPCPTSSDDGSNGEPNTILSKFALYPTNSLQSSPTLSISTTATNNSNGLVAGGVRL